MSFNIEGGIHHTGHSFALTTPHDEYANIDATLATRASHAENFNLLKRTLARTIQNPNYLVALVGTFIPDTIPTAGSITPDEKMGIFNTTCGGAFIGMLIALGVNRILYSNKALSPTEAQHAILNINISTLVGGALGWGGSTYIASR